ncbi:MAG: hypothetical protein HYY46_20005 [Deltaproteobacteria bacterium]|nr:hypothetical protein [Deltaproteobacteria bacterium]
MSQHPPPRNASTIIVIRPEPTGGFEVFMTRRPREMRFFGGFFVFPGGAVKKDDCSAEMISRCHGLSPGAAQQILGNQLGSELSFAHWVAGIRELFEEVGILLSVSEDGEPVDMNDEERKTRLAQERAALVEGATSFPELLKSEGLYCDVGRPVYFYHRITPEHFPVRFDTRFFLARMPADQSPLLRSEEVAETLWVKPVRALEEFRSGSLSLAPPTLTVLESLLAFDSWQSFSTKYRLR